MSKQRISCALNKMMGGESNQLLCYRIYIKARQNGGLWLLLEWLINFGFYLARKEKNHVTTNYYYQRRVYREAHQKEGVTQAQKGSTRND